MTPQLVLDCFREGAIWSGWVHYQGRRQRAVLRRFDSKGRAVVRLDAGRVVRLEVREFDRAMEV